MPSIGPISCVTIAAPDLQYMIDTYHLYLGYELVNHGRLSAAQAELWGLPGLTGRRYALMLPKGEGNAFIRFIDSKPAPDYGAFKHMGWNAAELMVQDTDGIAARLARSPFTIIGPPADLSFSDKIRAMQVLGPPRSRSISPLLKKSCLSSIRPMPSTMLIACSSSSWAANRSN